ncbi:DUF2807 domain-containing protein [Pelomonas sp. CA6]|uniref:head GIN domain-containing protein n=1 Tax=Pelomonas sp. CA6 TaxID=2907999 RepID=UPI001F4C3A72|nr:head GIN domain-containing protein [Pelomonas sp. CA6]MCH7343054.1 DUF2807 domain-containing protein [Pelomonas sp. CA6]
MIPSAARSSSSGLRRRAALALLGLAVVAGSAQAWSFSYGGHERVEGSGDVIAEVRELGSFDAIALAGSFNVQVRQGSSDKVEVRADRNLLPYIETRVSEGGRGRSLEIGTRKGYRLSASQAPQIIIEMRQLRAAVVAGSGTIQVDAVKTGSLDLSVAGSGNLRFRDLAADKLSVAVHGSGDLSLTGKATTLAVAVAGSGKVNARDLRCDEARVSVAGSGDVDVNAARLLKVSIAGSGDVSYVGDPELSVSTAGSGKVRRLKP